MFTPKLVFQLLVIAAATGCALAAVAAPPVTTGLLVNLNSDSASNFSLGGGNEVAVWNDLATDGSEGTVQSFGNADANNQPLFSTALMPNGRTMNVVDFTRGMVSPTSANNATADSDFLQSNLGGSNAGFAPGADAAYEIGGTAEADGISWFAVFRSEITTNPAPTEESPNLHRQGRQNIVSSNYTTTGGTFPVWNTSFHENAGGTDNTVPDLFSGIRDESLSQVNNLYGDISSPDPDWYIAAESWDLDAGTADSRFLADDGTEHNELLSGVAWTTSIGPHAISWIGKASASNSSGQGLEGQIAEILIYRGALNSTDVDAVMAYLERKYFSAQPGDFDGDSDVDGADFVVWQTNFPTADNATLDTGDADVDGDVDGADFVVWQTNFPTTPGPAVSPVPEPTAGLLLLIGGIFASACRRWLRSEQSTMDCR